MSIKIKVGRWDLYDNNDLMNYLKEGDDYFIGLFENSTNTIDLLDINNPFLFSIPYSVEMEKSNFNNSNTKSFDVKDQLENKNNLHIDNSNKSEDIKKNIKIDVEEYSEEYNKDDYLFSLDDGSIETESEDFVYMGKENLENQLKKEELKSSSEENNSENEKFENLLLDNQVSINKVEETNLAYSDIIEIQFRPNYDKEKVKLFLLEMIKYKELNKSFFEKMASIFKPALNIAELDLMDEHINAFTSSLDDYFYNQDLVESFARPIAEYIRRKKYLNELEFKFVLEGKKYKGLVKPEDKTLLLGDLSGNSNSQNKLPILIEKIKSRREMIVHDINYKLLIQK